MVPSIPSHRLSLSYVESQISGDRDTLAVAADNIATGSHPDHDIADKILSGVLKGHDVARTLIVSLISKADRVNQGLSCSKLSHFNLFQYISTFAEFFRHSCF